MSQARQDAGKTVSVVYTIGHSNHEIQKFVELLKQNGITAIADVRSSPYSRHHSQFNKDALDLELESAGIAYVFLGKELGARPQNSAYYNSGGQAVYDRIAAGADFKAGVKRLIAGAKKYRIAIMCAEKDPLDCHRTILICRHLKKNIPDIRHILADGSVKSHSDIEQQLIQITATKPELFDEKIDIDAMIDKAYQKRQHDIAYQEKTPGKNIDANLIAS